VRDLNLEAGRKVKEESEDPESDHKIREKIHKIMEEFNKEESQNDSRHTFESPRYWGDLSK
jgi:hypothetical protein